jgi:hypothetical protein
VFSITESRRSTYNALQPTPWIAVAFLRPSCLARLIFFRSAREATFLPDFSVQFDLSPFEALDQLALLARQDYNLGGAGDWFGEFRGGLYGFYARMYGVQRHYYRSSRMAAACPNPRNGVPSVIYTVPDGLRVGVPCICSQRARLDRDASRFSRCNECQSPEAD